MSRFPEEPDSQDNFISGRPITGAFECECGAVVTEAVHSSRDQKLYWKCPDGHENFINFKL